MNLNYINKKTLFNENLENRLGNGLGLRLAYKAFEI